MARPRKTVQREIILYRVLLSGI